MVPSKLELLANHSLPIDRLQTHRPNYSGGSYEVLLAPASNFAANICAPACSSQLQLCAEIFGKQEKSRGNRAPPAKRASESGHVGSAVHDPDDGLIAGEPASNIGKVRAAMGAVSRNGVAVLATLGVKPLCAFIHRSAGCADDGLGQRVAVKSGERGERRPWIQGGNQHPAREQPLIFILHLSYKSFLYRSTQC